MRFIDIGGELTLQAQLKHGWEHIIGSFLIRATTESFEITNWYTATHPETPYQGNIIVARPGPDKTRITMYNARVTTRDASGRADKRWLQSEAEYYDVLSAEFGLNIADVEIEQCIAVMKTKGTGDSPHPFFA